MANETPLSQAAGTSARTHLRAIAQVLHNGENLDPQARAALADFIDELSNTLESAPVSSKELVHLTECAAHLLQTEQQQHDEGIRAAARERLEKAILGIQTQFPNVAGIARGLVDTLANIGI